MTSKVNGFLCGVFFAMQYLALNRGEPTAAKELALENSMTKKWALAESRRTGYRVREMNKFIREELP